MRIRSALVRLCLAMALAAVPIATTPGRALAQSRTALVIGVGSANGCTDTARDVATRLGAQGIAVIPVLDPSVVGFRTALDDYAASLDEPKPGLALVYVCAPAVKLDSRLFVLPSGADAARPALQGVVLHALLNALAGAGGTLYADLGIAPPDTPDVAGAISDRLPQSVHVALHFSGAAGEALVGRGVAGAAIRVDQDWPAIASALAGGQPPGQIVLLPVPAAPAAPPAEPASPPVVASLPPPAAPAPEPVPPAPQLALPEDIHSATPPAPAHKPLPPRRAEAPRDAGDSRTERLQRALARKGFYQGPISGRPDATTWMAIRNFQQSLGAAQTGTLTHVEIVRLLND